MANKEELSTFAGALHDVIVDNDRPDGHNLSLVSPGMGHNLLLDDDGLRLNIEGILDIRGLGSYCKHYSEDGPGEQDCTGWCIAPGQRLTMRGHRCY